MRTKSRRASSALDLSSGLYVPGAALRASERLVVLPDCVNNLAERRLCAQVLGRPNWTFLCGDCPVLFDRHLQAPRHRSLRLPSGHPPSPAVPDSNPTDQLSEFLLD